MSHIAIDAGSPPRMRGKLIRSIMQIPNVGITPAHAGKTESPQPRPRRLRDHPRACGENLAVLVLSAAEKGSPPRMRGKLTCSPATAVCGGITPAHAGKTALTQSRKSSTWDHPRACGENLLKHCLSLSLLGSPPRMRGKHNVCPTVHVLHRITPAHAGKTQPERISGAG